jgi:D-sedoheptulose 7-phosphate isomerase
MNREFLKNYTNEFIKVVETTHDKIDDLIKISDIVQKANKNGRKTIIVGNGGSAAISSHFSVDLTKNAKVRCINFNEADLITCFANDYGYERWIEKAVEFYGNEGDVFIAISTSGTSKNILNGCKAARKMEFANVITLSGHDPNNDLRSMGDINLWADSRAYNFVENLHQFWLLSIVDLIIGESEYSA